jgi:cell division protein FtsQ
MKKFLDKFKSKNTKKEVDNNVIILSKEWPHRILGIFIFLLITIISGVITWVIKDNILKKTINNTSEEFYQITGKTGFILEEILIEGRKKTSASDLTKAIDAKRGMPILLLDLKKIKENVEKLPWVEKVIVQRKLPNLLYIKITERKPIAIWQNNKKFFPIDETGEVIQAKIDGLSHLPILVGKNAPKHTSKLFDALITEKKLAKRVKAATFIANRRWDVILDNIDNGIEIKLPEDNFKLAWNKLAKVNEKKGILKRKLTIIDLRLSDRVIVKLNKKDKKSKHNNIKIAKNT